MRYTLHDYQDDAVKNVLRNLEMARVAYKQFGQLSQFSLTALTGAGKTVMAAGVIEALFFGSDEYNFPADSGAVVLWFSDDPALNQQSRIRIQAAASELDNRLRVVETDFAETKFEPSHVYFLNTQKLSSKAKLVKGANVQADSRLILVRPDKAQTSIYDVIRNTIEDEKLTLYMVLDEAHRGMGNRNDKDRSTIVQRLINGQNGVPPMPIVWGISATVERFTETMKGVKNRTAQPAVLVDAEKVQESGLLKDDIVLGIPDGGTGGYDLTLLRRAVDKIKASDAAWKQYTDEQGLEPVAPLLVIQMADKATNEEILNVVNLIHEQWPELPRDSGAIAHVFGDHKTLTIGREEIPYIAPEQVQDTKRIRVLLAKSAISTGWDCPRAEVLMSFRPAQDETHITQLLGRMMRTPLARRIAKNQLLNSVDCLLPFFNREMAKRVGARLTSGDDGQGEEGGNPNQRVLIDPIDLTQNPAVAPQVVSFFESLPTMTLPRKDVKPIKRLTALATALSKDELVDKAVAQAYAHLHSFLDAKIAQEYQSRVEKARENVLTMKGEELRTTMGGNFAPAKSFSEEADPRAIEASFQAAARVLSNQLAKSYAAYLAGEGAEEDELMDAHIDVAAIGQVPDLVRAVELEADRLARQWLHETRELRRGLSDARKAEYTRLEAQSTQPERTNLVLPEAAQTKSGERLQDGTERPLDTYQFHLLSAGDGTYPADLNGWEKRVLNRESEREGFVGWYRNPSRGLQDSLAVPYKDPTTGDWKPMRPDFLFFSKNESGQLVADLVDPHGYHLTDALPKLRGLANFTEEVGDEFRRIEAVADIDGVLWKLDLKKEHIRTAIREATDAKALYLSEVASSY